MADWPTSPPTAPPSGPPPSSPGLRAGGADYPSHPPEQWPAHAPMGPVPPWGGPPVPGPSPAPPGGPDRGRGGAAVGIAVVVVCVLALLFVGVGSLATSDSAQEATDTTIDLDDPAITAPPSEEPVGPTMPTFPGLGPGAGAEQARPLDEVLPELIGFVERTRGLEFVTEPVVQAVSDEEFERLLAEANAEEGDDVEEAEVAGIALGLLPTGFDLAAATEDLGAVSVLGFYDPDTDELYVKGEEITPFVQTVIAHELTHALDDQHFDLSRLDDLGEQPDEAAFAFLSLVEGSASVVGDAYEAQLRPEDAEAYEAEEYRLGLDQLPAAMGLPPVLLVESQVPYASGRRFVDALLAAGGTAELDAAFEEPPTTSEQILEPEVYFAGEGAVALRAPEVPDGVEVVDEGGFGAADLRLLEVASDPMRPLVDPDAALLEPFDGYGGGRFATWTEDGRSCISLGAVGDDAAGSAAIRRALDAWAGAVSGAEVGSRPGGGGVEVITATRCG